MSEFLITDTKEIALITINNLPNNIYYISKILNIIKEENIEIGFFTKQYYLKNKTCISFVIRENLISKLFEIIKKIKTFIPEISTEISGNNAKATVKIQNKNSFMVLTEIFNVASNMKVNIHILNYTDNEISVLLPLEYLNAFKTKLAGTF